MNAAANTDPLGALAGLPLRLAFLLRPEIEAGARIERCGAGVAVMNVARPRWAALRGFGFEASVVGRDRSAARVTNLWRWSPDRSDERIQKTPEVGMPMTYGIGSDR